MEPLLSLLSGAALSRLKLGETFRGNRFQTGQGRGLAPSNGDGRDSAVQKGQSPEGARSPGREAGGKLGER